MGTVFSWENVLQNWHLEKLDSAKMTLELLDLRFSERGLGKVLASGMSHRVDRFIDVSANHTASICKADPLVAAYVLFASCLANWSTLKMEVVRSSETSVSFY
jgi:hypothetical protein